MEKVQDLEDSLDVLTRRKELARDLETAMAGHKLEDYFDFLEPNAVRIKGHRLGIEHVLEYYQAGYTADEIAREFPGLSLEKIHATITYYLCHQAEVDAYLTCLRELKEREYQEWLANPSPVIKRLQAIRAQRVESSLAEFSILQ